ncbi:MAG: TonB-dependent receptor [Gammaproteobacteria bacterium]
MRVGLRGEPTDQFTAIFKLDHDNLYFGSHATTGIDPLTAETEDIRHVIANGEHKYRDKGERASLNLTYDFPNGASLTSLTGYSTVDTVANRDVNASDPAPFGFRAHGTFRNWSQEIDLLSPEDQRFRWVVGAFWQDYLNDIPDYTENGIGFDLDNGTRLDYTTPWRKDEEAYAFFGQIEFDLTDELELQVGARWNHYEFDQYTSWALDFTSFFTWLDPAGTGIGTEGDLFFLEGGGDGWTDSFKENSTDWKINLNWQANENNFFYALISRGHTPGSINLFDADASTPEHSAYDEMSVINYETGWKATSFDSQLHTQLNVYYQVFKDYQANFALRGVDIPITDQLFQFQNAQTDSNVYGVEFGAQAVFDDLEFDMGVAYFKSELGSFGLVNNEFQLMYGGPDTVDLDGSETPFAPKWTGNVGVGYTFHAQGFGGHSLEIVPRVDVAFRSDSYARLFQNPATKLEGYALLNAQLHFNNGPWSLVLWGTNLTDKKYVGAKQNIEGNTGPTATIPFDHFTGIVYGGLRRLYGLRLSVAF